MAIDLFFSICRYRSDRDITLLLPSSGLDWEVLAIFSVRRDSFDGIVVIRTIDRGVDAQGEVLRMTEDGLISPKYFRAMQYKRTDKVR